MKIVQALLLFTLIACSSDKGSNATPPESSEPESIPQITESGIPLRKLKKLFTTGDFNGDGVKDTVFQHTFSRLKKTEIDSAADPFPLEWEAVVQWFNEQDADVFIRLNKSTSDTLHLGFGQGLYCLLNIGDNNSDGKEGIALVTDHCDFSSVNSCRIFGFCGNRWKELKSFGINESAFNYSSDTAPTFTDIPGYLEKTNGSWTYLDYSTESSADSSQPEKKKPLRIGRCRNYKE